MQRRDDLILFFAAMFVVGFVALFQHSPGYMDADYYLAGALRLWQGQGFTEVVLWNYLDGPLEIPHPSHGYWMPLASIVGLLGLPLSGWLGNFNAAQIPFLLIAAAVAPLTARLAFQLNGQRWQAWLAGALAALPGFYIPFHTTTDTFGLYMLLGASFFLMIGKENLKPVLRFSLLGVLVGLMHLTRADGLMWLLVAWIVVIFQKGNTTNPKTLLRWAMLVLIGYLLVMGPWMLRNLSEFGTVLSPGGSRALWLVSYNELFSYPADALTPSRWWAGGWAVIGQPRVDATINNLLSTLLIQGAVIVLPLILLGLWKLRDDLRVKMGIFAWLMTFIVMTYIFPDPGWRGGFFHSASALQPLLWAVAPVGLGAFVSWWSRWRKLSPQPARVFFRALVILVSFVLVAYRVNGRLWGGSVTSPAWSSSERQYIQVENSLMSLGAETSDIVLVNNPPGYYVTNQRPAIVLPDGDPDVAYAAALQFGAKYMILDANHAEGLSNLYASPGDVPGWIYLQTIEGTHFFEVDP
ncbi:MAG: hypothetical protein DWQ07_06965 [Chloroflexi bacterium]|nr:MAG: hypothetical protein DWQ07_06965 [Chloroflexota bacterium]MBL1195558.1 hypothetical protein [Chloroflexota bacterium]NOH12841.1 hypothetical protein [Chloroflexota bacterium]